MVQSAISSFSSIINHRDALSHPEILIVIGSHFFTEPFHNFYASLLKENLRFFSYFLTVTDLASFGLHVYENSLASDNIPDNTFK